MARSKGRSPRSEGEKSEALQELEGLAGAHPQSAGWVLDGVLLAAAFQQTTRAGAALQLGTSLDGTQLTLKVWDKGFPLTMRAEDPDTANQLLRKIALAYCPKSPEWDQWRRGVEDYG